jgi:hypothetical protein
MGTRYSHLSLEERCRLCGMMEMDLRLSSTRKMGWWIVSARPGGVAKVVEIPERRLRAGEASPRQAARSSVAGSRG